MSVNEAAIFGCSGSRTSKMKCPSGIVIVRKKHAAGGHDVFGVMDKLSRLVGSGRRDQFPIGGRCRVGVDHGQEIIALILQIPRPCKKVMAGLSGVLGLDRDYQEERIREKANSRDRMEAPRSRADAKA